MRPSVISDVASRPPRPHDVKTPEFAGPPLFIRIGEHHTEYKPRSLVFNRPAWRTAKQIPPTRRALRDAERESLASRAMVRRLARSKPAARQKSLYDMTPEEYAAAEAAALRSTATDIFAPAAEPPPAKEPWHITANVAGVKALGEVPADSHHWSLRVNVAHVVGLGEDGQRPLLTVRENEFDTPGG